MKILLLGSGGREHALVKALAEDPAVQEIHVAPGNTGIAEIARIHPVEATNSENVVQLARSIQPDLVVIGPEAPLIAGVSDALRDEGFLVFGPSREAAALEGSKAFAKQVMAEASVPTAMSRMISHDRQAVEALEAFGPPYVVKDDGLASGKGVLVTDNQMEALYHAQYCLASGHRVLVEEYLQGPEVSLFVLSDGRTVVPLEPAQDFKRIFDGDEGPNTGGMGAYSPLPWVPEDFVETVVKRVAQPTIDAMARRGTPFVGVLYCGLALTTRGIKVIEFNARFGDPETQVVLPRLQTPLAGVLMAAAKGQLAEIPPLLWRKDNVVGVVLAARDYPQQPQLGDPVTGIEEAEALPQVDVIQAGTRRDLVGELVSSGGRVLTVLGRGENLAEAREQAYRGVSKIGLPGGQYRTDIAQKAAEHQVELPQENTE